MCMREMYHLVKLLPMAVARDALLTRIVADVAANGIGDRSLRDLAAAVGTSHRLLIYHFGSRSGLVTAIVAEVEARERELFRALAGSISSPVELVRALWRQVSDESVRPLVRLFFEALAYPADGRDGRQLTGAWLDDSRPVAAALGIAFDPVAIRLGVAVVRGLLIDVLATGDVAAADDAMERFLATWPVPAPATASRAAARRVAPAGADALSDGRRGDERGAPLSPRRRAGTARRSSPPG